MKDVFQNNNSFCWDPMQLDLPSELKSMVSRVSNNHILCFFCKFQKYIYKTQMVVPLLQQENLQSSFLVFTIYLSKSVLYLSPGLDLHLAQQQTTLTLKMINKGKYFCLPLIFQIRMNRNIKNSSNTSKTLHLVHHDLHLQARLQLLFTAVEVLTVSFPLCLMLDSKSAKTTFACQ